MGSLSLSHEDCYGIADFKGEIIQHIMAETCLHGFYSFEPDLANTIPIKDHSDQDL